MVDTTIFSVDGCGLTLAECVRILGSAGTLPSTVGAILREHVIDVTLRNHPALAHELTPDESAFPNFADPDGLGADPSNTEWDAQDRASLERQIHHEVALAEAAMLADLRRQYDAPTPDALVEALRARGQDLAAARRQIRRQVCAEVLKHLLTAPLLQAYFEDRAPFLERVTLTRLSLADPEEANELVRRLKRHPELFGDAAWECAERLPGGLEVSTPLWVQLPEAVRGHLAAGAIGDVLGPYSSPAEDIYWIFRIEARWQASLDDPQVAQRLRDELFEKWIAGRLESAHIEITPTGSQLASTPPAFQPESSPTVGPGR